MTVEEAYILLVEDNEDDIFLTKRILKKQHVTNEVVVVKNGAAALDFLFARGQYANRQPGILPQVVLLDINLPKQSGLEVLKEIRANEQTEFLPVVMLTSSRADRDIVDSYNNKANSYVRKPVDAQEFARAIKSVGAYWLLLNTPPRK